MTRVEYWILSGVSFVLSALLLVNYYLGASNNVLNNELARQQAMIGNAEQAQPVLDQLARRIAAGSERDPRLRDVLKRHGLQVTLDNGGKPKNYP